MVDRQKYTPKQIADILGARYDGAGGLARAVEAFWPTIEAALLAYDGEAVEPRPSNA